MPRLQSLRSLRLALISAIPQNVILFLIHYLREKNAVSEAFTQVFYYDGPMIPRRCLIAEYGNPKDVFGDQEQDHWLGPWTYWTRCELAFGQGSLY